jgi:hypothetical protein
MIGRSTRRPNLVPDPPRAVPPWFFMRRMRAMVFCGVLFGMLGVGFGVGFPIMFYFLGGRTWPMVDWALDREHAVTTATITDKRWLSHTEVNGRSPWRVAFRFTTPDGRTIEARGHTWDPSVAGMSAGDPIEVEYDPADPSRARPVGGTAALFSKPVFLLIAGAVVLPQILIGVVLLVLVGVRARFERLLLVYGTGTDAEVVRVRWVGYITFGTRHPGDVDYQFVDDVGRHVTGRDRTYHYDWAEGVRPGDRVGVVYHPQSPATNVLWLHGKDVEPEA